MTPNVVDKHPARLLDPYLEDFEHTPFTDFSNPENRTAMKEALAQVRSRLGATIPLVIGDREISDGETFSSVNPAHPEEVIARVPKAAVEIAAEAVRIASTAFEAWSNTPGEERADYLFLAAAIARQRRFELAAWMVLEAGKSWPEADGDVAEGIDFLEFYGRQMLRLAAPQPLVPYADEEVELRYIPLGVGAAIPPWNFPFAIAVGMSSAAIVAGNCVLLKPSSDSPAIGYEYFKIWQEVGLPAGVCNFVPGSGSTIGSAFVKHPKVRFIAFTGSKEVGIGCSEEAGKVHPDQIWLKRAVLEMGGKDGIIVDSEANIDEAVEGVVSSAFGFQGQKCSACSRAIVDQRVYDEFLERLIDRTAQIAVGDPQDPKHSMGPVINQAAFDSIREYIEIGKQEGRLVAGGGPPGNAGDGYFLEPTIIADVDPEARISLEEIFGPVLTVIKADDYDDALRIANNTEYGLTGAVYTENPDKIRLAKDRFHVGNLYINRKCTGAMVGTHPFGGFNLSGTDSKAGGQDYLLLFTQAKAIARKTR